MYKYEPKKLTARLLEFAAAFALSCFLIRLGLRFLLEIRWAAAIVFIAAIAAVILCRVLRRRGQW
jgi:hypothetical protein